MNVSQLIASIWLIQVVSTWYMTGLIWFVQISHYPLMNYVRGPDYVEFQKAHMKRTSLAVGPMMAAEALTGAALLYMRPAFLPFSMALLLFCALLLIWISTALLQVPCHLKLERGFNALIHRRLVASNWIRTALWTIRALGLAWYLHGS